MTPLKPNEDEVKVTEIWQLTEDLENMCGCPADVSRPIAETLLTIGYRKHPQDPKQVSKEEIEKLLGELENKLLPVMSTRRTYVTEYTDKLFSLIYGEDK